MTEQKRGQLTARIRMVSRELMGKDNELNVRGLRFMAYVQYTLVNSRRIEPEKINSDEVLILNDWFARNWLGTDDDGKLTCTKEFWDIMSEIIYLGYVDLKEEDDDG